MLLSVFTGMDKTTSTGFWHWVAPALSALVSVAALAALVFYTGGAAQRLSTNESVIQELKDTTIKKSEIEYRLNNIDKNLDEIKVDLKEIHKK